MFGYLFATLLLPMFAHMIKKKQTIQPLTDLSFKLLMIPALTLGCIGLFYATPLMNFLYHHHAELSAPVFSLLMFCFLCISTSYIFGTLLTANGSLKSLNLMALAGMALNIVLNLFLIPNYKASGAAVAGLITQAAMALTQLLLARKILAWKINRKLFLQLFIFTVVLSFIAFALSRYKQGVEMIPVIALISLLTAMLLGLLRLKELKTILAER